MPIAISEYLGQQVNVTSKNIIPQELGGPNILSCCFSGLPCQKLNNVISQHPICSVRVYDENYNGTVLAACSERFIPVKTNGIWPYQLANLGLIAKFIFPEVNSNDIGYRKHVPVTSNDNNDLFFDYVLQISPTVNYARGPKKVILEVQGGGETNSTGAITAHVAKWVSHDNPTNEFLSRSLDSDYVRQLQNVAKGKTANTPGIIPNNAWKRQLDQVLKKAVLTKHFGGSFALVVGEVLYDYIKSTLSAGRDYFSDWDIALVGIAETPSPNSSAILFNNVSKAAFMTYNEFIAAIQDLPLPVDIKSPFVGDFTTLRNKNFKVE